MKNKEMKKPIPVELDDDALDAVSGGAFGDLTTCPVCGRTMREGYICTSCEMDRGSVMCPQLGHPRITRSQPCRMCGRTWDIWVQETAWLRG